MLNGFSPAKLNAVCHLWSTWHTILRAVVKAEDPGVLQPAEMKVCDFFNGLHIDIEC